MSKKKKEDTKGQFFEDLIKGIKGLNNKEFTMEGVKFQIKKLSPFDGFHLFEEIRHALFTNADSRQGIKENNISEGFGCTGFLIHERIKIIGEFMNCPFCSAYPVGVSVGRIDCMIVYITTVGRSIILHRKIQCIRKMIGNLSVELYLCLCL